MYATVRICDIAEVKGGKRMPPNASLVTTRTNHPYIRGRDIRDGKISVDELLYVRDEDFEQIRRYTVNNGDVCITIVGNIGDVGITPPQLHGASLTENAVKLVNLHEDFDPGFITYALLTPDAQSQMKLSAAGAAQAKLGIYKVNEIRITAPPLAIQKRIADILSAYDELIENSQRRIKILEAMARGLYREWFVHFRFPGHENHPRVASALGEIPQGWEAKMVSDILTRRTAGVVYRDADAKPEGIFPVIDQSTNEFLGFHDNEPDHLASVENPLAIFGDHTCKMQLVIEPFSIGPNVVPFAASGQLPTAFVFYAVNSLVQTQEYKRHWSPLNSKEIVVANNALAQKFADLIKPMLVQQATLRKSIRNLRRTRDLLLPRLLSGQINVEAAEHV